MTDTSLSCNAENYWRFECYGPNGELKWSEVIENLVVTAGKNDLLTNYFKGSAYTAAFYIGLTGTTPTFAAADTMASHSGWTEVIAYTQANRVTISLGTPASGSVDNSASPGVFGINTNATTIGGGFLVTNNTKGGTTGTLYGGAAFTSGDKVLGNGDTLNVTITLTV